MKESANFLKEIVSYYTSGRDGLPPLEQLVFVSPNKRSGAFLKKHVQRTFTSPGRMPRFMTMRSFIASLAHAPEGPQNELRFMLYEAYRNVLAKKSPGQNARDFDAFIFWADVILSDFDEIDRYLINAPALFKNLGDLKSIQADYLDPAQKEIIRRIWGDSRLTEDTDRFWIQTSAHDADTPEGKFRYLWELLGDIYEEFHSLLDAARLSTQGKQCRQAMENLGDEIDLIRQKRRHYVFVGFNELSVAEILILEELKNAGVASFFWDIPSGGTDPAFGRIKTLAGQFPPPEGFATVEPDAVPEVTFWSVPSNVAQAKTVEAILRRWVAEGKTDPDDAINTAIVLPDQSAVMSLMFSIPEMFKAINLTLGLPFRSTSFASLLKNIVRMQLRSRRLHGRWHFFFQDVLSVINHPHIRYIAPEAAEKLEDSISESRMFNIDAGKIAVDYPDFGPVFMALGDNTEAKDGAEYLMDLFVWLLNKLEEKGHSDFETAVLENFSRSIAAVADQANRHRVEVGARTFLRIFERLLEHTGINMEGTPLKGLQILGVLETRSLDFDNVIVISMNEGTFPQKQYTKTMIPGVIRAGYNMPEPDLLEQTYAYSFFRLISRAKNVALVYDSRGGNHGGEISRYANRLRYLFPKVQVSLNEVGIGGNSPEGNGLEIEKKGDVAAQLDRLRAGGDLYLSAAALKSYKQCPLQFYLKYVRRFRAEEDPVDFLNAADTGNLVHESIQALFKTLDGLDISEQMLTGMADPRNPAVGTAVEEALFRQKRFSQYRDNPEKLPTEAKIMRQLLETLVRSEIEAERDAYCSGGRTFRFGENELSVKKKGWKINDHLSVNWRMSIDRVDRTPDGLRFVDFKTGSDETTSTKVENIFTGDKLNGMMQVLAYCEAYLDLVDPNAKIEPVIHSVRKINRAEGIQHFNIAKHDITDYSQIRPEYAPRLREMIEEIFNGEIAFTQAKPGKCNFCQFLDLCGRTEYEF